MLPMSHGALPTLFARSSSTYYMYGESICAQIDLRPVVLRTGMGFFRLRSAGASLRSGRQDVEGAIFWVRLNRGHKQERRSLAGPAIRIATIFAS